MSSSGLILAIETSNPGTGGPGSSAGVAIGRLVGPNQPPAILGVESLLTVARHEDDLMPAIDRLFRSARVSPKGLARVAVSVGPGGFTSLRVACAAGKMIAEAIGARCVAVPSALVVAARAQEPGRRAAFGVALAAKEQSAWVTVFEHGAWESGPVPVGRIMSAADLLDQKLTILIADRFLPESMRAAMIRLGGTIIEPVFEPAACLELATRLPDIEPALLLPLYPREPEAVTLWRRRPGAP